jgi:hypothetical protein
MPWWKWLAVGIVLLALMASAAAAYGCWRWAGATHALLARIEAARLPPSIARYDARETEGLPEPVRRYFRAALTDGQPIVTAVSIRQAGTFNMSETGQQWQPFTASQRVIARRPGFVWDARISMLPGVPVHVHDAYVTGAGALHGAVLGLIPVVTLEDSPGLARGELMRFLAECAWYPTALLPSQGVRWDAIDDRSARATLTDGAIALTLTFVFQPDGLIDTVRAESRERVVGGTSVSAPWQGRFWNYETRAGMRVPLQGEVAWMLPRGGQPYWRGAVTALAYEFAP